MMSGQSTQPEEAFCEMMRRAGLEVIRSAFKSFMDKNKNVESFHGQDHLFNSLEAEIRRGLIGIVDDYSSALRKTSIPKWAINVHIDEMKRNMNATSKEASDAIRESVLSRCKGAEEEAARIFERSLFD